ncbi:MAG: DUF4190 domain-containing protein [Lachnospiraceae bacterium]|nr:DUF4190 domain-containing protein [Lachnospiraceae bacterium]
MEDEFKNEENSYSNSGSYSTGDYSSEDSSSSSGSYSYDGGYTGDFYGNEQERPAGNGFGIAALVLGIISVVLFWGMINFVTAILAIIFGAIHIAKHKNGGKGFGIAGLVLGIISIIAGIAFWIFAFSLAFSTINNNSDDIYNGLEDYFGNEFYDDYYNGDGSGLDYYFDDPGSLFEDGGVFSGEGETF